MTIKVKCVEKGPVYDDGSADIIALAVDPDNEECFRIPSGHIQLGAMHPGTTGKGMINAATATQFEIGGEYDLTITPREPRQVGTK